MKEKEPQEITEVRFNDLVNQAITNFIIQKEVLERMFEEIDQAKDCGQDIKFYMAEGQLYFIAQTKKKKKIGFQPE